MRFFGSCLRKKQYKKREAEAKGAAKMRHKPGLQLYTYRCPYCGMWHLTHHSHDAIGEPNHPVGRRQKDKAFA